MENKKTLSPQQRKQRFLFMLPPLVLPFITVLFWVLGGGSAANAKTAEPEKKGINSTIPDAQVKEDGSMDKLSFYDQATKDSALQKGQLKSDPNYTLEQQVPIGGYGNMPITSNGYGLRTSPYVGSDYNDPNEAKIYQRLERLNHALAQPEPPLTTAEQRLGFNGSSSLDGKDVDRLEQLMKQMHEGSGRTDPEMDQINGVLEKIMDIQNPDRVKQQLKQASKLNKESVYAVSAAGERQVISLLETKAKSQPDNKQDDGNGFYSLDSENQQDEVQNTVDAVIHETQTIVNGSTVKIRLLNDIYIDGRLIPKDNFVFGIASLNGERLDITINSIRFKKSLFPVSLSVVDIDGMGGIYIPGAISRDVAKQSTDRAIQDLGFGTMSDNIGVQAAGAGLEAAKSLFSKKVKLIKVTVKAGYKVMLKDDKQKKEN